MKYDLYDRERVRNIYVALCYMVFLTLILLADSGYSGWVNEFIIGFGGGSLISYISFCFRHRLPILGGATFARWESPAPLTLLLLSCALITAALLASANGGKPIVMIGVLLSQPIFQITYEAWWDKKQEHDLKKEIGLSTDEKITSAIANLRKKLAQEKNVKDRDNYKH